MSILLIYKLKPKLVIGFGGYPSFPPLIAAIIMKVKYLIHEQNAILGKANEYLLNNAEYIATSFKDTQGIIPRYQDKIVYTGNPIRNVFTHPVILTEQQENKFKILVIGGSQGASIFSQVIPQAVLKLPEKLAKKIQIFQQCRPNEIDIITKQYNTVKISCEAASFFHDIHAKMITADLVIARAGATTIAELAAIKKPAILVPLPNSIRNHQLINAQNFAVDNNNVWIMEENKDFSVENLTKKLKEFFNNKSLSPDNNKYVVCNKTIGENTNNLVKLVEQVITS